MPEGADILIGIDSGTSVVKAVAFDLAGSQIAAAAVLNRYDDRRGRVGDASRWRGPGPTARRRFAGSARRSRAWRGARRRSR